MNIVGNNPLRCETCDYWRAGKLMRDRPADRWGTCDRFSILNGQRNDAGARASIERDGCIGIRDITFETFKDFGCSGWWEKAR